MLLLNSLPARGRQFLGRLAWGATLFVMATGCGDGRPQRVPISGQVLIDGQPLVHGDIMFVPPEGRASRGKLDKEGRFQLTCYENEDGALLGIHKVAIRGAEEVSFNTTRWHAPKKLSNHQTSGLTQEITGPAENLVVNISWNGGQPFTEVDESAVDASARFGKKSK